VAKVSLRAEDFGLDVQVEMNVERCTALALVAGDIVFVAPRRVRVFVPEEAADAAFTPEYAI
jgi:hypothetical protein